MRRSTAATSAVSGSDAPLMREFLFPTSVWFRDLENSKTLNRRLLTAIGALRKNGEAGIERSNFLGWHSTTDLHERAQFSAICSSIVAVGRSVLSSLDALNSLDVEITQCWANMNGKLAHNHRHLHPGDDLSGVYYVRAQKSSGPLMFYDPRPGNVLCTPTFGREDVGFCKTVAYGAQTGRMIIFPGWLEHAVAANQNDDDRISIAFNLKVVRRAS